MLRSFQPCSHVGAFKSQWLCRSLNQRLRAPLRNPVKTQVDKGPQSTNETKASATNDEPVWVRRERERELARTTKKDLPWGLYLLGSIIIAIAAVGSVFEYFDKNAIFGVVAPDSPFWAPILGIFTFTGLPMSGFLFIKGVNGFNEEAELQDKIDGLN